MFPWTPCLESRFPYEKGCTNLPPTKTFCSILPRNLEADPASLFWGPLVTFQGDTKITLYIYKLQECVLVEFFIFFFWKNFFWTFFWTYQKGDSAEGMVLSPKEECSWIRISSEGGGCREEVYWGDSMSNVGS